MTIIEVWIFVKQSFQYLLGKWKLIVIIGIIGSVIGLTLSFLIKPKYTAKTSFSLIEGGPKGGGFMDIVSNLGLSSILGGGNEVFSGDNLLEIMKSRYAVEHALLSPVIFKGERKTLIEAYIDFNKYRKKWSRSKKKSLRELSFPIGLEPENLSRTQDSVISVLYTRFIKKNHLKVIRLSKKVRMSEVIFVSKDEEFSKLFVDNLMEQTSIFYKQTKTSQILDNLRKIQHTADSIKVLYESALAQSSLLSGVNINKAFQVAMVPKLKQEYDVQLYGTVYAEVLKNLETLKLDLARETPIIQIIDTPRFPLKKDKLGKIEGIVLGGLFAGFMIVFVLLIQYYFNLVKQRYETNKK